MNFQIRMGPPGLAGGAMYNGQVQHPPPPPSQHYGACQQTLQHNVFSANAWQAMNFRTEDEFRGIFEHYKSDSIGGLQGHDLCALLNDPKIPIHSYYGITWSLELCKIMLAMMDRDKNGIMIYEEFRELLNCLVYWKTTFQKYDTNRSGFIEAHELNQVITQCYRYTLSQNAITTLLKRYSRVMESGQCLLAFDDFVSLSVRLRAYTEAFRARDRQCHGGQETGSTTFGYDDFLQCVMCL